MISGGAPAPNGVLSRIERRVAAVELAVASTALGLALGISLYAILMRALRRPTGEWVLDLPIELLLVIAVYGSGALMATRGHMRVEFAVSRLAPAVVLAATLFGRGLVFLVCATLTSRAIVAAGQLATAGLRRQELFGVSEALLVWASAVGLGGWTLHAGLALWEAAARSRPPGQRGRP